MQGRYQDEGKSEDPRLPPHYIATEALYNSRPVSWLGGRTDDSVQSQASECFEAKHLKPNESMQHAGEELWPGQAHWGQGSSGTSKRSEATRSGLALYVSPL